MANCSKNVLSGHSPEFKRLFEKLFENFRPRLISYANRFITDTLAAEDIVTDAFISFWEHPKQYQSQSHAKRFLYTCIRNACINLLEQRKYHKRELVAIKSTQLEYSNFMNDMIRKEVLQELKDLLSRMPPQTRKTAIMFYVNKIKYNDIAIRLNKSPHTVRNNIARATQFLREHFRCDEAA